MSSYQSAYKSLLQGVSQQLPFERLPGQVTAQINMMSDPTTGLRRRPGTMLRAELVWPGVSATSLRSWFVDIAGARIHVYLNTADGVVKVLDESYNVLFTSAPIAYLVAADSGDIRETVVGDELFLCNVKRAPVIGGSAGVSPTPRGFAYVVAGSFGRNYTLSYSINGGAPVTAAYLTPNGQGTTDAENATPEYIAQQLQTQLSATFPGVISRDGPYLFFLATNPADRVAVSTSLGTQYVIASQGGFVTDVGKLPARLPTAGDGYICRVGTGRSAQYYRYDATDVEWLETGAYGSPDSITNVPVSVTKVSTWEVRQLPFEGRLSGDDENNPAHRWMASGITGIGTHQGRLVLLSGSMASLSASGKARRFFRTTAVEVLPSDPIEVGSGMNSSASYEWAIPFNKDLLCFSRGYQAVIPTSNTAITPSNATIVPTSAHEVDTYSSPIVIGRTAMYCTPKSEDFFGVMEVLPSNYTASQYVSQDATPHLPKYMPGRCRFAVASSVASMALFAPAGDTRSLVVHEYHWDGDTKAQQAWHKWTFMHAVATAYFASDLIVITHVNNGRVMLTTIDPRAGFANASGERRPYLDLATFASVVDNVVEMPSGLTTFDPSLGDKLTLVASTGQLAGELVGIESIVGSTITTVRSQVSPDVAFGIPFYSGVVPTPPIITDRNGQVIHMDKATLLRLTIGTRGTSEFQARVSDAYSSGDDLAVATLTFSHPELALGRALYAVTANDVIPCRTDLRSTDAEFFTAGPGELNITSLEYVARYQPKIKRW